MQTDQRWQDSLPQKYHHFAGNYHNLFCKNAYRFGVTAEFPYVVLRMAPPAESTQPTFYDAEGYAKQLIGQVGVLLNLIFGYLILHKSLMVLYWGCGLDRLIQCLLSRFFSVRCKRSSGTKNTRTTVICMPGNQTRRMFRHCQVKRNKNYYLSSSRLQSPSMDNAFRVGRDHTHDLGNNNTKVQNGRTLPNISHQHTNSPS